MYGCTGVPCVKKIEKAKNENEAIQMRLVTMVMLYLCFSKYCIILGSAAGVFTEKCRNTEPKNTTNKWVDGFYFTLIMVA